MYKHLIEFYNSHPHSMKYHENSPECTEIRQLTSFLDKSGLFPKINYVQRIWHIRNNDFSIKVCPICGNPVKFCHKEYVITCSKKCYKEYFNSNVRRNKFKETCLRKYGVENFSKSKEFIQKSKETSLRKYGTEYYQQTEEYKKRAKKTCLEKYGTEYYNQTEESKKRTRKTNLRKYGTEYYQQTEESKKRVRKTWKEKSQEELDDIKEKSQKTCLEKYGVLAYSKTDEFKQDYKKTCLEKYNVDNIAKVSKFRDKAKETCLQRYGTECYLQTEECKERIKNTNLERYGVDNPFKSQIIRDKAKETCLQRYGTECYLQTEEYKNKSAESNKQKYGVDHYSKTDEFKEKLIKTNMNEYGVKSYRQTEEFKEKSKDTSLRKYGAEYYMKSSDYRDNIKEKFYEILDKAGYIKAGYKLISYNGNGDYEIYCPHCNNNFIVNNTNHFYHRHRRNQEICTNCNPLHKSYSYGEKELVEYVSSIYNSIILENDRSIIHPYELDIYLPDLRLAIEYNGDYWHANPKYYSEDHIIGDISAKEVRKKDKQKINRCIKAGVELLVIWEDDWINRQDVVKQELSDIITELVEKRAYN